MMPSQQLLGRGDSRLGSAESLIGGSHVPGQVAKLEPGSESYTGPHTQALRGTATCHFQTSAFWESKGLYARCFVSFLTWPPGASIFNNSLSCALYSNILKYPQQTKSACCQVLFLKRRRGCLVSLLSNFFFFLRSWHLSLW